MSETSIQRRLAAILAADVVGYSKMMGEDEAGTLAAVRELRIEVIEPKIAEYQGRLFKTMGDGFLVEFPSVVNAVACASAIQTAAATRNVDRPDYRRLQLRIGVHLGDVISEGGDIYGDGVNIAARIESLAPPGSVAISAMVHDNIGSRLELDFEDIGEHELKNIAKPVRVYRLAEASGKHAQSTQSQRKKPTIAALPFTNMSGEADQDYFADGVTEDIITELSRFRNLFVIARNSSFIYKGRAVDVKKIGIELGVNYVLEGSVRRAGNRMRITGQLVDTGNGAHLWAERYDGNLEDVFDLQDKITSSVVGAVAPKLELAEIERAKRKPTGSLDAYDHYLRGVAAVHLWTAVANKHALEHFYRSIELDPNFSTAYGMAARCYSQRKASGWVVDPVEESIEARRLSRRAAELGHDDALALCAAGLALAFVVGDLEEGVALTDRALELNPHLLSALYFGGWVRLWNGEPEIAIERLNLALQLSPGDPQIWGIQDALGSAHFVGGDYAQALKWARAASRSKPDQLLPLAVAASSAGLLGLTADATRAADNLRRVDPHFGLNKVTEVFPELRQDQLMNFLEGLRRTGFVN